MAPAVEALLLWDSTVTMSLFKSGCSFLVDRGLIVVLGMASQNSNQVAVFGKVLH